MKGGIRQLVIILLWLLIGNCLVLSLQYTKNSYLQYHLYEFEPVGALTEEQARTILMAEEKKEEGSRIAFWNEVKEQTISYEDFQRSVTCKVVKVMGSATLLFPHAYPLTQEDQKGCLIGETTAWELFGERQVIGETVQYESKEYIVRDIMEGEQNLFLIQGEKDSKEFCTRISIQAVTKAEKENAIQKLQFTYGIPVKEIPLYWYRWSILGSAWLVPICLGMSLLGTLNRRKKSSEGGQTYLYHGMFILELLFLGAMLIKVFGITSDDLPGRLSDLSYWSGFLHEIKSDLLELIRKEIMGSEFTYWRSMGNIWKYNCFVGVLLLFLKIYFKNTKPCT